MRLKQTVIISILACVFHACVSPRSGTNLHTVTELSKQSPYKKIKKILIIGQGGAGTRFFLENLSETLTQKLKQYNVNTAYEFLGYKEEIDKKLSSSLSQEDYDAVLRFIPTKEEQDPIVVGHTSLIHNTPGELKIISTRFVQGFDVVFLKKDDRVTPLWKGALNVNFDPRQKSFYTKTADDILYHLQESLPKD